MQTSLNFLGVLDEVKLIYKPSIKVSERPTVNSSNQIFELLLPTWEGMSHYETFKILLLNRGNKVLGLKTISTGGVSGTVADPRLIFQTAILTNASGIILLHNHPSGNLQPSEADKTLTKQLRNAGKILEIPVLDHIILTEEKYFSFSDEGLL